MDHRRNKPPIMYDPLIIPRVKQYLEENVHQTYVDVNVMAKELQERYKEYTRRKVVPFKHTVEQAYKTVLHSYGLDSNPSSDDNDGNSDLEMMDEHPAANHMNNMLTHLYMNNTNNLNKMTSDSAPIDISSDEGEAEDKAKNNSLMKNITITKLSPTFQQNSDKTSSQLKISATNFDKLKIDKHQKLHSAQIEQSIVPPSKRRKIIETQSEKSNNNDTDKKSIDDVGTESQLSSAISIPTEKSNAKVATQTLPLSKNTEQSQRKTPIKISSIIEFPVKLSKTKFQNIGGMEKTLKDLCEQLLHISHPVIYRYFGLPPPRGFLLHGPSGCGKTLLARGIAGQLEIALIEVAATELIGGISGESEERIRQLFEQAANITPCVLFIDDIDAISSNRLNAHKDMERRVVTQLLNCLDTLSTYPNGDEVIVIGATNRADSIDPALRRIGRFDQEICVGIPNRKERGEILQVICRNLQLCDPFDYDALAALTPGYVGADLLALTSRAASNAVHRVFVEKFHKRFDYKNDVKPDIPTESLLVEETAMETDSTRTTSIEPSKYIECTDTQKSVTLTESILNAKENIDDDCIDITNKISDVVVLVDDDSKNDSCNNDTNETNGINGPSGIIEQNEKIDVTNGNQNNINEKISLNNTNNEIILDNETDKNNVTTEQTESIIKNGENIHKSAIEMIQEKETQQQENENQKVQVKENELWKEQETNLSQAKEQLQEKAEFQKSQLEYTDKMDIIECLENKEHTNNNNNNDNNGNNNEDNIATEKNSDLIEQQNLTLKKPFNYADFHLNEMIEWLSNAHAPISLEELKDVFITMNDFIEAVKIVQPSAKREGFVTVPDVTWNDIGSLRDIREELQLAVLAPVKFPEKLIALSLEAPSGVLLCGPPGCGKTLLAKAVANEAGVNFISVKGPELLNKYVGESERAVRQCFQRARNSAPCVIFFDEFDSLCPRRSDNSEGSASTRVVNQLLTEMDGIEERKGIYLLAASNRPDMIDPAVLRPGRLDKILYVGLPNKTDRLEILQAITKNGTKPVLANDVNLEQLAVLTEHFSGADLAGLIRQASVCSLRESITSKLTQFKDTTVSPIIAESEKISNIEKQINDDNIKNENNNNMEDSEDLKVYKKHFLIALKSFRPSVSEEENQRYEKLREKYIPQIYE